MTLPTTNTGNTYSAAPNVFISSTIVDLADLRSAIRFVLRQSGVNVLMSESTDFPIHGDKSACEECFENIRNSDIFVLLLDKRQGSEYEPGVSVTRMELRVARESFIKSGKPHQLYFIRHGILDLVDAGDAALSKSGVKNPEHLRSFISEVMESTDDSPANFLKQFTSFDDIMESITARLNLGRNLAESIARKSVYMELTRNLAKMVSRIGNGALEKHAPLTKLSEEFDFQHLEMTSSVSISEAQRTRLGMGVVGRVKTSWFELDAIKSAVKGGVFLDYDPSSRSLVESGTYKALQDVLDDVQALASLDADDWDGRILSAIMPSFGQNYVSVFDLVSASAFSNRSENLFNSMRKACWLLLGSVYSELPLPRLPVTALGSEMDLRIRKERIEHWEVDQLFQMNILPFGLRIPSEIVEKTRATRLERIVELLRATATSNPELQFDDEQITSFAQQVIEGMEANPGEGLEDLTGDQALGIRKGLE